MNVYIEMSFGTQRWLLGVQRLGHWIESLMRGSAADSLRPCKSSPGASLVMGNASLWHKLEGDYLRYRKGQLQNVFVTTSFTLCAYL